MKKVVITYGTFDLFHIGHLRLLERAKSLSEGGTLIVAVSTDEFNRDAKHKKTVIPYSDRAAIVSALKCVDRVIPEKCWGQKASDIAKYGVDIFVIGDDWEGKFDFLKSQCEVIYLPRTVGISSTDIKESLMWRSGEREEMRMRARETKRLDQESRSRPTMEG